MSATIEVNKQSVKQLLESGKEKLFVIPEYQRPYGWNNDQIITLFDDLWEFTEMRVDKQKYPNSSNTYFLGSIVSFENANGEQEIIDGQQRITSLFLLLRALYSHIEREETHTKEAENFMTQIEAAVWHTDNMTGEVDFDTMLLVSRVMNNEGNEILKNILKTGKVDKKAKDPYSLNYQLFTELIEQAAQRKTFTFYEFVYSILNCAILLPISADSQNTALTIFSTLNDRGLQLSDADIFKAKIYNNLDEKAKKEFINEWQNLEQNAEEWGESIQSLFYYYMFYLRALEKDVKTTTPGLRKYYAREKFIKLYDESLLDNLSTILQLWYVINMHSPLDDENWSKDPSILKLLDILNSYSNEFWKYPVIVYYLKYKDDDNFINEFRLFLQKLTNELLTNFLEAPTINAVKPAIMRLNSDIIRTNKPKFTFKDINNDDIADRISSPHRNAIWMLLKIQAYNHQDELLPEKWEIEHILPKKYQQAFFMNENDEVIKEKIEHLGNKIPIEKKINIVAGNGYFAKKKELYLKSSIAVVKELGKSSIEEWKLDEIIQRDYKISQEIINTLKQWDSEYVAEELEESTQADNSGPTPEQQKVIDEAKEKGWI